MVENSLCSPDLVPTDVHLISALKLYLSRYRFTCDEDIKRAIVMRLTEWDILSIRPGWAELLHAVQVFRPS